MSNPVLENQIVTYSRSKQRHNTRRQFQKRLLFEREVRREMEKIHRAQRRRGGF